MQREYAFDAFAVRDLAHRERGIQAAVTLADDHTFKGLQTFTVTFSNPYANDDSITGVEFR